MSSYKTADSDVKMMIASQVAYLDGDEGMTVGELVDRIISNYEGHDPLTKQQESQLNTARTIQEQLDQYDIHECERWVIKAVDDQNKEYGFYGCLIDTRDGEAILGFRGSENFDSGQVVHDWLEADFGLLNNPETKQQQLAAEFTQRVNEEYGNYYNNYNFAGHSLGGNLAEHATITAPDGMPINRCVSYDGPGYSDEYIAAHGSQIKKRGQYIDHYQYSVVGALLTPLPGTNYRTIDANDPENEEGLGKYFGRHSMKNIQFDRDGNVKDGEQDWLAQIGGPLSKDAEHGASILLWMTFPQLALLWSLADAGYTLWLGLKDKIGNAFESIGQALQDLKKSFVNWYRSMFGVALTGEYELSVSTVNSLGGSLDDVAKKLKRISGEISDIAQELRYNSLSGSYYKSRIRSLSSTVTRDGTKAEAMADAARDCVQITVSDDNKAAQSYAKV